MVAAAGPRRSAALSGFSQMTRLDLERLCARFGVATSYRDVWGAERRVPEESLRAILAQLGADAGAPAPAAHPSGPPPRCFRPESLENGARLWGPAVQLYALRSERNWGIGDLGDLLAVIDQWGARGAGVIGVSPLHALFPHDPERASPYSPSSRLALNVLYIDVEAVEDYRSCEEARSVVESEAFRERLARLRSAPLVDYAGVARAKFEVLELLHAHFRERHLRDGTPRAHDFRTFVEQGGEPLRLHALCEALQERFHALDASLSGWPAWPAEYRDPGSNAVQRLYAERIERVEYFLYLQWQAEQQLGRAAARCKSLGLALGLYLDVALSVDRGGSETWANQDGYALGASIGAPPDTYNLMGQDWGLPPLAPGPLRESGYALFAATLRAAMRHAGAIRLDHAMALTRLFWIPSGAHPRAGTYVRYELEEMLAVLARESERNRCLVIGEDLGTVPDGFRASLGRAGVLSYRILYFERHADGGFIDAHEYPRDALAALSSHDLPTLAGWWTGNDLGWRERVALFPGDEQRRAQLDERAVDRARLAHALVRAGVLSAADAAAPSLGALADAAHAFLARSPAFVMMVQLEDALGVTEQANLPGTVDEHPNWRRKLPETLERMERDPRIAALSAMLGREREK
jgi:(1->4)-alpha-D-glucan 1-alpha-D-glucosylmutase